MMNVMHERTTFKTKKPRQKATQGTLALPTGYLLTPQHLAQPCYLSSFLFREAHPFITLKPFPYMRKQKGGGRGLALR